MMAEARGHRVSFVPVCGPKDTQCPGEVLTGELVVLVRLAAGSTRAIANMS